MTEIIEIPSRKRLEKTLISLCKSHRGGLSIALDAEWGEGKTVFARKLHESLKNMGYISVYFDAHLNEFTGDPFLDMATAVQDELVNYSDVGNENILASTKKLLRITAGVSARIAFRTIVGSYLQETVIDRVSQANSVVSDVTNKFEELVEGKISERSLALTAVEEFRNELEKFTDENKKLIVLVDELDRCRPNYSLRVLETVKHIFSVKGVIFITFVHREQLEISIRSEYGSEIKSAKYLQKFISHWLRFSANREENNDLVTRYCENCLHESGCKDSEVTRYIILLVSDFNEGMHFTFREVEQIIFCVCLVYTRFIEEGRLWGRIVSDAAVYCAVLKIRAFDEYKNVVSKNYDYISVAKILNLSEDISWKDEEKESSYLHWLIRYLHSNRKDKKYLIKNLNNYTVVDDYEDEDLLESVVSAMDMYL